MAPKVLQCRRCSLGNPLNVSAQLQQLQHRQQQQDEMTDYENGFTSDNIFGTRNKKQSSISLVNTRAFWPYPSAAAIAAASGVAECQSPATCSSSLEFEALAAVHRLSVAVRDISVSEMLPRTPQLIFVNVTTLEGQPYCLELTAKGWRITSLRSDCMQGDFTRMELFTAYYESIYDLMSVISPSYKEQMLASKRSGTACDSVEEDEDFEDGEGCSCEDTPPIQSIPNNIQLCPTCCCASVAVPAPIPTQTTVLPVTDVIVNSVINQLATASSGQTNTLTMPTVSTCRCGTMRRGSSVGSQALEESENERKLLVERLRLLNERCQNPKKTEQRLRRKLNSNVMDTSSSSDDGKLDSNTKVNTEADNCASQRTPSIRSNSSLSDAASSTTSGASSRRNSQSSSA